MSDELKHVEDVIDMVIQSHIYRPPNKLHSVWRKELAKEIAAKIALSMFPIIKADIEPKLISLCEDNQEMIEAIKEYFKEEIPS